MTSANATGQLIFLPVLATIVTAAGWRWASATVAVVALLVVVPLAALIMRDHPSDVGLPPYGGEEIEVPVAPVSGPDANRPRGAARGRAVGHVLAARGLVLRVRRLDERPGRHAPDPGRPRPRRVRGDGRVVPGRDRRLRHHRDHLLRLAHRPLRPAAPALLVLRAARPLAARPPLGARLAQPGAPGVRRVLRPGLGRDGAADGRAHGRRVRAGASRHPVRLDLRRAPVRRGVCGVRRRLRSAPTPAAITGRSCSRARCAWARRSR